MLENSTAATAPPPDLAAHGAEPKLTRPPGLQIEVDRATSAEWSRMLDLFDDANFYQTFAYGAVHWGEKNLSHLVLKRDSEVLALAQLRIIRPTPLKFGMAYLRWGPIFSRCGQPPDPETPAIMARSLVEEYVTKRRLFLRVLPNAFSGSPRADLMHSAFASFTREPLTIENTYRTFVLDLLPSLEELRSSLDKKWRNQLSRSEKNNLEVTSGNSCEEYRSFCLIYDQMLKRKSFETTVDVEEFLRIQNELPDSLRMRVLLCRDQGKTVAGLVVSAIGDSAIYLLGATSDDGLNSKGAYLLQWTAIRWLKERGIRWYDLGGIDPVRNPGVYHFKSGFSGIDVCQLNPLVKCDSAFSSAIVNAGLAMQRALRSRMSPSILAKRVKELATGKPT
jgi:lipid II:glycine glycyltransferase (peptidoglycan interpeptide bridge formation enzyme)